MGQSLSDLVENIKDDFVKETHTIKEVMGLTYSEFVSRVTELNQVCCKNVDHNGRTLLFFIKGGTDSTIFWKQTVQVACVRVIKESNNIEDYKLLNLKQFLQAYKMILYHMKFIIGEIETSETDDGNSASSLRRNPISTSMILNQIGMKPDIEECIICMERKPEITLPCTHCYCLLCIEQWNDSNKTCPVCRATVESTEDSWLIPEIPESSEVNAELQNALAGLVSKLSDHHILDENI